MISQNGDWLAFVQGVEQNTGAYLPFFSMVFLSLIISGIPVIRRPLQWAETFYHELSHGLMALATGGRPVRIELWADGRGSCAYYPGWRVPIALAGYMGATLWGGLLYLIGAHMQANMAYWWLVLELVVLALTWLLLVRKTDVRTTLVLLVIAGLYGAALLYGGMWTFTSPFGHGGSIGGGGATDTAGQMLESLQGMRTVNLLPWVLQFMGLYILLNGIRSPLDLLRTGGRGDAADLQRLTKVVPRFAWVLLWFCFGLAVLLFCACQTLPGLAWALGWPRYF